MNEWEGSQTNWTNKHALGWAFLLLILEDKELSILDH